MRLYPNLISEVPVQVVAPSSTVDVYREVMTGIQTGSYAVLLALFVVYVATRRSIGVAWHKHFEMMDTLKQVQASNARSLKLIADSNAKLADLMVSTRLGVDDNHNIVVGIQKELAIAQATLDEELTDENPQP